MTKKILSKIILVLVLLSSSITFAAQHDFVLSDNKGGEIWADLNRALKALATQNSGPTDPANPQVLKAVFTGTGVDDATSGGTFSASSKSIIGLEIDASGTPDTFRWRKNSGAWTEGVAITGNEQTITDGITVTFETTTGHTVGDKWFFIGLPGSTLPFQFWTDTTTGMVKQRDSTNTEWVDVQNLGHKIPPRINILGSNPVNVEQGTPYTDAGATAFDTVDGDISNDIKTASTVNTTTAGTYTVTYNVTDSESNTADEVVRTVNVADTTPPLITMLGTSPINVELDTTYTDAGATAFDTVDDDLTGSIQTVSAVNTSVIGSYSVTYNVDDLAGNSAVEVIRTVNVVADATPPVITMLGSSPVDVVINDTYGDAGATASDAVDGDLTGSIETASTVNTTTAGSYTVTYNVDDSTGNSAVPVVRTVNVRNCIAGSQTFNHTGADQSFTVPTDCTSLTVKAWGGGGGTNYVSGDMSNDLGGGGGGYVTGPLPVTPSETLTVIVGGGGGRNAYRSNAFGGGGYSGGGGRSAIRRGTTELITAGAGGGGGYGVGGYGGGLTGGGPSSPNMGGEGGTQSGGGAGLSGSNPGSLHHGGNGTSHGGGGSGYYGGGAGGEIPCRVVCERAPVRPFPVRVPQKVILPSRAGPGVGGKRVSTMAMAMGTGPMAK